VKVSNLQVPILVAFRFQEEMHFFLLGYPDQRLHPVGRSKVFKRTGKLIEGMNVSNEKTAFYLSFLEPRD
jgi:hypothetical protein